MVDMVSIIHRFRIILSIYDCWIYHQNNGIASLVTIASLFNIAS